MGPYKGGQAVGSLPYPDVTYKADFSGKEYVRVPFADFNALKLPPGTEHEEDFALLADIFPTVRLAPLQFLTRQ